jgi:hypothetical protein
LFAWRDAVRVWLLFAVVDNPGLVLEGTLQRLPPTSKPKEIP